MMAFVSPKVMTITAHAKEAGLDTFVKVHSSKALLHIFLLSFHHSSYDFHLVKEGYHAKTFIRND